MDSYGAFGHSASLANCRGVGQECHAVRAGSECQQMPGGRVMQTILNLTVMANDVAPQFLEYVGMQNECYTVGRIFYLFNIMDPAGKGRPQPGV